MPTSGKPDQVALRHCLSVDVEEHFMVEAFADRITYDDWPGFGSRVEANTKRILDLFARYNVRATFFIVGWTAERHPSLVRDIVAAGHEVGCHSHLHRAIWKLKPEEFRADLQQAITAIENVAGVKVQGFRAPTFSIVQRTLWALDILAEEGIRYDSSIFPIRHDYYGMPDAPTSIFRWQLRSGELYEIPMTTVTRLGRNFPAGGGGYLRLLPLWFNRWALHAVQREGQPAVVYLHPWEVDPDQPRVAARWKSRLRHYTNLDKMETRLAALLKEFAFAPMYEVLDHAVQQNRDTAVYSPK